MTDNERLAKLLGWEPLQNIGRWQMSSEKRTVTYTTHELPDYFNDANTRDELLAAVKEAAKDYKVKDMHDLNPIQRLGEYLGFRGVDNRWVEVLSLPHTELAFAVLAVLEENQ